MHVAHWLFARLRASGRRARSVAIVGAGLMLLSAGTASPAAAACAGSQIREFITKLGIVGWTARIDKSPKCAIASLVVVGDLIDADGKVRKLSVTFQYDANKQQLVKVWGIEFEPGYLYVGPGISEGDIRFVVHHSAIPGNSTNVTKVKMFATLAGRACRYEGPAFKARDPYDPFIKDCSPKRPGDNPRPPSR